MTTECSWIESRFESLFSDDPETRQEIASHLAECAACRQEVEAHDQVDRMVAAYFSDRVTQVGSRVNRGFPRGAVAAALAGFAAALVVWWGVGTEGTGPKTIASQVEPLLVGDRRVFPETPESPDMFRGKPAPGSGLEGSVLTPTPSTELPSIDPEFYVMDAAGYFHSLSDFSGSVLLLAVFDDRGAGTAAFEKLYGIFGSRPDLRLLAVALKPEAQPATTSFPILLNGGSSLLETGAGEFAIVTAEGAVHQRGSLEDEGLEAVIVSGLEDLGVQ